MGFGLVQIVCRLACLGVLVSVARPLAAATWSEDPAVFLSSTGGRSCTIGRSRGPCLSAGEAEAQAIDDAARQLGEATADVRAPTDAALGDRVRAMLVAGGFVRDRSLTVTHRPYGDIWSGMVLVDVPPARVAAERARWADEAHRARLHRMKQASMSAGVILLAYAAANAMTKGYFRGRLRVLAVLALALPVLMICLR